MNTLRALIIDDEPLAHKVILQYAKDVPFLEIVGQCYKATDAYALLAEQSIDLLFLDIQMPKLKGLDFLRTLDQKPKVIIASAYQEYALEGYELQVSDYLLKPFRFDRFLKAVQLVQQQLSSSFTGVVTTEKKPKNIATDRTFVKVDKRFQQLLFSDIHYLESYGNYLKIWTGDSFLLTPRTMTSFLAELPPNDFLRIHKSFVLRTDRIDYVEGNQIVLKSGQAIAVGKSFRATVREWLGN